MHTRKPKEILPVLSRGYWSAALSELHNLRSLIFAALVVALGIVISSFFIPVADNLRIYFKFLVNAVGASVYGPVVAILVGVAGDTLGFFIHPSGVYFPGYLLSEVLGNLVFALLLYRKRLSILRLFISRAIIDFFINVGLGSLWSAMLYSKGFLYYFAKSIVKNSLLLIPEVILLTLLFALLVPIFTRMNIIPQQKSGHRFLPWI